jgi:hypothetical protein
MIERLRDRQSSGRRRIGLLHTAAAQERWKFPMLMNGIVVVSLSGAGAPRLQRGGCNLANRRFCPQLAPLGRFG